MTASSAASPATRPGRSCHMLAPAYAHIDAAGHAAMQQRAQRIAQAMNWQLHWHGSTHGDRPPGFWCSQQQRLQELQEALSGDILWPVRGGYGCTHLLPSLQKSRRRHAPLLIGFSDITLFHALWQRRGWGVSYYAMMPAIASAQRAEDSLLALLRQGRSHYHPAQLPQVHILHPGQAQGPCFAACLSILASCCGTPAMPTLRNHILCLEDIDEAPYAIDRNLWQLWHAGHLHQLRGIIWGRFPGCIHHHGPSMHDILSDWSKRLAIPSIANLPFGHDPDPIAIPCGGTAILKTQVAAEGEAAWALELYGNPYQPDDW